MSIEQIPSTYESDEEKAHEMANAEKPFQDASIDVKKEGEKDDKDMGGGWNKTNTLRILSNMASEEAAKEYDKKNDLGRIRDVNKAHEMANAEKPFRDVIAENKSNQFTKPIIEELANNAGEKVGKEYEVEETKKEVKDNKIEDGNNPNLDVVENNSFEKLFEALGKITGLEGSAKFYSSRELIDTITGVKEGYASILDVTRTGGLRTKVKELLNKEAGYQKYI